MSSPPRTKRDTPPRLPSKKRSQSLAPLQQTQNAQKVIANQEKYCSADGVITEKNIENAKPPLNMKVLESRRLHSTDLTYNNREGVPANPNNSASTSPMNRSIEEKSTSADGVIKQNGKSHTMSRSIGDTSAALRFSTQSLPRISNGSRPLLSSRTSSINRENSDQSLSPCQEDEQNGKNGDKTPSPPPKPSRFPPTMRNDGTKDPDMHGPVQRVASYHASGSDSGNGSGDSVQSSTTGEEHIQHRGVIIKNPRFIPNSASSMTLRSYVSIDPVAAEAALLELNIPMCLSVSKYDLENFNTLLLPYGDYKPLDSGTLHAFRMMLCETGARVIANHLTRVDISLILGKRFTVVAVWMIAIIIYFQEI
jgi:SH2 domain-containing protein 3C